MSGFSWNARQQIERSSCGRSRRARSSRRLPMKHQGQITSEKISIRILRTVARTGAAAQPARLDEPAMPRNCGPLKPHPDHEGPTSMSLSPTTSIFDRDLPRGPANHSVLTPLDFLDRAVTVYPDKPAVVHGTLQRSYAETYARCRRLASALKRRGIGVGDTVSVMLPNTPAMLEAHYGVPKIGRAHV